VGPFLMPGIVCTALLVWKPNPWFYLAAGISISYLFILFLPFIIGGLSNPASPYEFAGYAIGLISLFWALPAGVTGFLRARKRQPMADIRSGWRTRQGIYALAVVFVAVGAIVTSVAAYAHASGPTSGGGFDFAPSTTVTVTTEFPLRSFDVHRTGRHRRRDRGDEQRPRLPYVHLPAQWANV